MKEAKLFKNGRSQAVRLPMEFRMPGDAVYIRKLGNFVLLIPKKASWESMFEACDLFSEDFMTERHQGGHERRESFQ